MLSYAARFHLPETSKVAAFIESESRAKVNGGWDKGSVLMALRVSVLQKGKPITKIYHLNHFEV